MKIKGFTLAELVVTSVILMIVTLFAMPMAVKKNIQTKTEVTQFHKFVLTVDNRINNNIVPQNIKDANKTTGEFGDVSACPATKPGCKPEDKEGCKPVDGCYQFTIPNADREFFKITLIGGGSAASGSADGVSGEFKEVYYPTLLKDATLKFRMIVGKGGTSSGAKGGDTAIFEVQPSGKYTLIEQAKGGGAPGITSSPVAETLKDGITIAGEGGKHGGNVNGKGGAIIISWE